MKKIYILGATLLGFGLNATAQVNPNDTTLNRTVVVEKEYNPIIQGASKVNVLPKVEEPVISTKEVEYAFVPVMAESVPVALIQPMVAKEFEKLFKPGYLRLGYGSHGNLDARAHYTARISAKDKLGIDFQMGGVDGKINMPFDTNKWKSRYYKTRGGLDYIHQFNSLDLNIFAGVDVHNFNLFNVPGIVLDDNFDFYVPRQNFTKANFGLRFTSTDEEARIRYDVGSQFSSYSRKDDILDNKMRETLVQTDAKLWMDLNTENKIGLDVDMFNRMVNSKLIDNTTTLDLNPYYGLNLNNWKLRLGANIDLGFGYGESFLVSPDVDIQYIFADSYVLYAKALGGRSNSTFTRFETVSPYTFIAGNNRDTYEQLNASIGFKASPIPGLWLNAYGGFQKLKDDLYQSVIDEKSPLTEFANEDTKNFYVGANIDYNYKDILELGVSAVGRKWKTDGINENALLFKPKMELGANILVRPISPLAIAVNYKLISRDEPTVWTNYLAVEDVSNLSINASYLILKNLRVYGLIDNLLNKKYQYYYGYTVQGTNFMAGLSFQF